MYKYIYICGGWTSINPIDFDLKRRGTGFWHILPNWIDNEVWLFHRTWNWRCPWGPWPMKPKSSGSRNSRSSPAFWQGFLTNVAPSQFESDHQTSFNVTTGSVTLCHYRQMLILEGFIPFRPTTGTFFLPAPPVASASSSAMVVPICRCSRCRVSWVILGYVVSPVAPSPDKRSTVALLVSVATDENGWRVCYSQKHQHLLFSQLIPSCYRFRIFPLMNITFSEGYLVYLPYFSTISYHFKSFLEPPR